MLRRWLLGILLLRNVVAKGAVLRKAVAMEDGCCVKMVPEKSCGYGRWMLGKLFVTECDC